MEVTKTPLTGRRFFIYMILFFGTVTLVNIVFVSLALKSNTGVVTQNPYQKGLEYDKVLDEVAAQKALGWVGDAVVENGKLVYTVADANGKPIESAKVSVLMQRPVQNGYDFTLSLIETRPGRYEAPFEAPLKGAWNAHISLERGTDKVNNLVPLVLE